MVVTQELTGPAAADPATAARIAWMTTSLGVGALIGVLLTLLEQNARWRPYVPSPTGMGIAMLIPVNAVTMIFLGAAADAIWAKTSPELHGEILDPDRVRLDRRGSAGGRDNTAARDGWVHEPAVAQRPPPNRRPI